MLQIAYFGNGILKSAEDDIVSWEILFFCPPVNMVNIGRMSE